MKTQNLIFVNTVDEVEEYIRNRNVSDGKDSIFIALTPRVYLYLKQRGISTHNTLPYFSNESHKRVLEKSKILIDWIRMNLHFEDIGIGVHQAYKESSIYWMRFAVHHCLWLIEIVSNAVDTHQPAVLSAALSDKKRASSLLIQPEERALGWIIKIIAQQRKLKFEDIAENKPQSSLLFSEDIKAAAISILKYLRFQINKMEVSIKRIVFKEDFIFFTTRNYQMGVLEEQLKIESSNARFYLLGGPVIPFSRVSDYLIKCFCRRYSRDIIAQRKLFKDFETAVQRKEDLFSFKDTPFIDIILQKFKNNIIDHILGLMIWTVELNQFIDLSQAAAFISNGNRDDDCILAELCREKNIPSILISHGSHVPPKNEYENIEWGEFGRVFFRAPFSHLALQTPLAEDYLKIFSYEGKGIKTGPLIWGKSVDIEAGRLLFKEIFNEEYNRKKIKIVMHAGTPKTTSRFFVYETPDEYLQALSDLAKSVEKMPDTVLIIRFRPTPNITVEILKDFVSFSDKVILSVDEPFLDVLGMADLLVSFSSTTIEEALQNRIPVLLYGGRGRYKHIAASDTTPGSPVQPSAVYHIKETGDLSCGITNILDVMGKNKEDYLFDKYIYLKDVRVSLSELLK